MPVATAKTFGSMMTSSAGKPTSSTRMSYARREITCRRARLSAWPCSSKAMTTIAAPYLRHSRACSTNASTPSFIEIELTIGLPCTHLSPASMTSHLLESIISGTREMSGSLATSLTKRSIASTPSIIPSSMLMSMTCAPASTCWRATLSAVG